MADKGLDFCLMIPTEQPPEKPEWYSKYYLWAGLHRYGIETTAAIIERKVEETGGNVRVESLEELSNRLSRKITEEEQRRSFLSSQDAIQVADEEAESLFRQIELRSKSISTSVISLVSERIREQGAQGIAVGSLSFWLTAKWCRVYTNSLKGSLLAVEILVEDFTGFPNQHKAIREVEYRFDRTGLDKRGWRQKVGEQKLITSEQLIEYWFREFITRVAGDLLRKEPL